MRKCEVDKGSYWNDPGGVDSAMTLVVVALDVPHIDGVGYARHLIELAQVARQVQIVCYPTQVALEMAHIDRIKPQQRRK